MQVKYDWAGGESVQAADLNENFEALLGAEEIEATVGENVDANESAVIRGIGPFAFDAAGSGNGYDVLSRSHTCSGSDRLLVVGINSRSGTDSVTGVTYNGVAMTLAAKQQYAASNMWVYMYYLLAPATGANTITVTASANVNIASASYTGVLQSGALDATANTAEGNSNAPSSNISPTTDWCFSVMMIVSGTNNSGGNGTNFTVRSSPGGVSYWDFLGDNIESTYNGTIFKKDSTTQTGSMGNSGAWACVQATFKPASVTAKAFLASAATVGGTENYIGFFKEAATAGNTARIHPPNGKIAGFTGLIPAYTYYLNNTAGTIGVAAGSQSKKVGIALTDTVLLGTNSL